MLYVEEGEDVYVTETIFNRETGLKAFQRIFLNGLREAPPDGSPSEIGFDDNGRPDRMAWHSKDRPHREDGPASVEINPENGIHVVEHFMLHGESRDPSLGPQWVIRDSETGEITEQKNDSEIFHSRPNTKIKFEP